ncbi:(2Fe-2S)-binding protein [Pandoraea sp.]|uniref:(2Fe-2S)-binding protein n=1 Tax=Pandoraea sp. TaxID=1883445 RepID=UPI001206FC95|nr:(2Fe-2S)-binding protein [Pandoraea sp.]TAL56364.1 MAG: (2Fe-2S)-binding protein [Pandoraea sp.]TAM20005.1 MAG: (2Fe-2S)-binding protein [Pandoraea sp.]
MPETITLEIDARTVSVPAGSTVAAAIARASDNAGVLTRRTVNGGVRGPLCGMGICQECRVTIDGRPHRLACQTLCTPGMVVVTMHS